jgi:hypothetical protein
MKTILVTTLACAACHAQSVTIVNSGSTNTAGFQIVVEQSGHAEYTLQPRRRPMDKTEAPQTISKTVPKSLADSLYADVEAARPLSSLPAQHCIKSASFGTRLFVQLGEDRSPDLSCGDGGNEKMRALIRDAEAVVKIFRE